MPKANKPSRPKPWYTNKNAWAWIVIGICIIAFIVLTIADNAAEKRSQSEQHRPSSYEEIFTPEEASNADPALDAIQDGDYHDLLDQMGGPEGF